MYRLLAALIGGLALFLPENSDKPERSPPAPQSPDSSGVAVVELFTSEGCSSCPPADRLLRSIVETSRAQDRPVYGLSFHVDYWNDLGWEDPYSDEAYTQRQRRYSRQLGIDTYTPQIIVNGQTAMIGSRPGEVRPAIQSAVAEPVHVDLALTPAMNSGTLHVEYRLTEALPADAALQLAVVERGLSQDVRRGENRGRTLQHANVVRAFTSTDARQRGTARLDVPPEVDTAHASLIGYVQIPSMAVVGATRVDLDGV